MKRPEKGRALFYTRDSGGKHETTPTQYVNWAAGKAQELGLRFTGTPEAIEAMIASAQSHEGDLFLDYGVSGHELSRQGLNRLLAEVATDENVTHVLIPRRDRFARPDDPTDAMVLETSLSKMGVTLIFMDRVVPPIARGERPDIGTLILGLVDYDHAGKDRRELARKILFAQLTLAKNGYSIGGRPPYGFCRTLVKEDGTIVRALQEGERVRMPGHHVVWMPLPEEHPHVIVIRRILSMLEEMPASRVAAILTSEGIPSPDAGRVRKDNGVRHQVSGVWHQTTVINIARNPLLLAICSTGRRSMGDQLRHTPVGPRTLVESDFRPHDGKPKVIQNPEANRIVAPAHFHEPLVDPERQQKLLETLDKRGTTQRGKPRSYDPDKNPLGGRVFDLNCSWLMYRVPHNGSFRYSCAAYMQSHGQQCSHNHVDGPTAARFAASCLVQKSLSPGTMAKLEARLNELANRELGGRKADDDIATNEAALTRLNENLATASRNLALADSPERHKAIGEVFDELMNKKRSLEGEIAAAKARVFPTSNPEAEVRAALAVLGRLPQLVENPKNLAALGAAFRLVNLRMFVGFEPVQVKKRVLNRVSRGVVTFGSAPPPIPLYDGPVGRRSLKMNTAAAVAAEPGGGVTLPASLVSGREGNSLGNVSRGDRIRTCDLLVPNQTR